MAWIVRFIRAILSGEKHVEPKKPFCPRCSANLMYRYARGQWVCDRGHAFMVTDPRVSRFSTE
jgi:ribosomal protein S27AE